MSKLTVNKGRKGQQPYTPHAGQLLVHFPDPANPWRYIVLPWGRRSGKTICAAAEVTCELAEADRRAWVIAPDYELTDRVFSYVWDWVVNKQLLGANSVRRKSMTKDNRYIEMVWGSFVKGKSAESSSNVGEQLDLIVFDECAQCDEKVWLRDLEPTTIDRKGRVMFISTPRGMNWFAKYYYRGQDNNLKKKGWLSYNVKTEENPHIDAKWVMQKRAEIPDDIWKQEYEGSFTSMAGLIYPDFKGELHPHGHIFDPEKENFNFENKALFSVIRGIDVGLRHPTSCVWIAIAKGSNDAFIFREYEEINPIHEVHAEAIAALSAEKVAVTTISPDAKRKNTLSKSTPEDRLCALDMYRKAGIYARPASDNVRAGIAEVARYLRATLEDNPIHPRLWVSKNCPLTIDGFRTYQYKEVNTSKEVDQPEAPRKFNDHIMDAIRYALATSPRYRAAHSVEFEIDQEMPRPSNGLPSVPYYG